MKEFILILFNPKGCFRILKITPFSWGKGMIILLFLVIINSILSLPIGKAVMNHSDFFSKMPDESVTMLKATQEKMKFVGLFTSSLFFVIKMFFYSLILWLLSFLGKKDILFIQILSLFIISYFIVILGDIINTGIIYYQGIDEVTTGYSIYKTGFNLFFNVKSIGPIMYSILTYINPFQLWFIFLLITGLNNLVEIKVSKATAIILIFWIITVALPVFFIYLSEIGKSKAALL